ncbi:hypothetical protein [Actinomycetospora flava]|uniref:Uncharacterized protein n=1 Tax=Actinomycetospora flava TaxID=3129232 RepID=A0ABU8M9F7_9PSEU
MLTPDYDRAHAFVVALADGSVLACSGSGVAVGASGDLVEYLARTSELFEPVEEAWRPLGRLAVPTSASTPPASAWRCSTWTP